MFGIGGWNGNTQDLPLNKVHDFGYDLYAMDETRKGLTVVMRLLQYSLMVGDFLSGAWFVRHIYQALKSIADREVN